MTDINPEWVKKGRDALMAREIDPSDPVVVIAGRDAEAVIAAVVDDIRAQTVDEAEQLAAFHAECDAVGVPYDAAGLVRHWKGPTGPTGAMNAMAEWESERQTLLSAAAAAPPVTVTDAMVERAARELVRDSARSAGHEPSEVEISQRMGAGVRKEARVALTAALTDPQTNG